MLSVTRVQSETRLRVATKPNLWAQHTGKEPQTEHSTRRAQRKAARNGRERLHRAGHSGPKPRASLADMLQFNRSLTSLDISKNSIVVSRGGGWTHDPGDAYYKYVHTDGSRTNKRPDGVEFEADLSGIQALAGALKVNRALTSQMKANSNFVTQ